MSKLSQMPISDIIDGLETRQFTSLELVETYILRINQVNLRVHAVAEVNPEATAITRVRDQERAEGRLHGRLHGVPILIKDVFMTTDQMNTTVGCSGLVGAKPKIEATAIKKLRENGAIILGKTVLTQWANYRGPAQSSNGWSAYGGQCQGIFYEEQDPYGSSAGSAVATALGLAAAALGTETSGSIASPAKVSGLIGLKPTVGLTSRYGTYCVSEWQDTVGVLARNVIDAATILSVIAGNTKTPIAHVVVDMAKFLGDFKTNPYGLKTLADVIEHTSKTPAEMNERWGMEEWLAAEETAQTYTMDSEEFNKSLARRLNIARQIPELLDRYQCDIIVVPSWTDTTSNVGGCPSVSVPMGQYPSDWPIQRLPNGLVGDGPNIPIGLMFVGRRYDDARLIGAAYSYEQATEHRKALRPVIYADRELEQTSANCQKQAVI